MDKKVITEFIMKEISGTGIFLVDVLLKPGNVIHIYVDKPEGITIDECVQLSRDFNASFDREIEDYDLQVSSPGLDMPLRVKEQFEKNREKEVQIVLSEGKKIKGILKDFNQKEIVLLTTRKEKIEGKKKKKTITEETTFQIDSIKAVKASISFK
ncbi:MAG: ribosome assembly cofactor RimP [Bacteroidales bacterium]